jgi:hypothetical protein
MPHVDGSKVKKENITPKAMPCLPRKLLTPERQLVPKSCSGVKVYRSPPPPRSPAMPRVDGSNRQQPPRMRVVLVSNSQLMESRLRSGSGAVLQSTVGDLQADSMTGPVQRTQSRRQATKIRIRTPSPPPWRKRIRTANPPWRRQSTWTTEDHGWSSGWWEASEIAGGTETDLDDDSWGEWRAL